MTFKMCHQNKSLDKNNAAIRTFSLTQTVQFTMFHLSNFHLKSFLLILKKAKT